MFERPNPELDTALELSKSDPQQAAQVLRIAASYLKKQEQLPSALALFLGDAFEHAMKKPTTSRGSQLLINLSLEVAHRRPKANFEYVGIEVEQLVQAKIKKGEAISRVGETYGIDDSTVKRMHKKYLALKASEEDNDALIYEAEQRNYVQQSALQDPRKIDVKGKRSKEASPSELVNK
jgi:LysM repeat protein